LGLILAGIGFYLVQESNSKIKVAAAGAAARFASGWQCAALRRRLALQIAVLLARRNIVLEIKSAWHHLSNVGMFESDCRQADRTPPLG
jgi:hypothetical protein